MSRRPAPRARARRLRHAAARAAALSLAAALAACVPSFPPLAECYVDTDCPSAQSCLARTCVGASAPLDAGARLDAAEILDAATADASGADAAVADASPPDSGYLCPDGPYGTGQLYFGAPVVATVFDGAKGTGALSPDGRHFIKGEGGVCPDCYDTIDFLRWSVDAGWSQRAFRIYFWADHLRLSGDALLLYGCHGGELKCGFHRRLSELDPFQGDADYSLFDIPGFDRSVTSGGGAIDYAMLPTPDGRQVAFASNRRSATDDGARALPDLDTTDLWTAALIEPGNPRAGFERLVRHPAASSSTGRDLPEWIADDASMVIMTTRLPGRGDTDIVLTSSVAGAFGAADRLEVLSSATADEDGFSMPSLATLRAHGDHGEGYVRRTLPRRAPVYYVFPVCVGRPNP